MRLAFCILFVALIFALPLKSLEKENRELTKANQALRQVLKTLATEEEVGFSNYKCAARNDCIYKCQNDDEDKTWYSCMKECPKKLCEKDDTSDSVDPEDSDLAEEAVGLICSDDGFEGTVTTDSWCDKRDYVWMHACSDCKHGYYWYWWYTYCCTSGKSGCTCAN